jgi:hypothetical protein
VFFKSYNSAFTCSNTFFIDCHNIHAFFQFDIYIHKVMNRRDLPKNPVGHRYNVPRPGENRPGNKFYDRKIHSKIF